MVPTLKDSENVTLDRESCQCVSEKNSAGDLLHQEVIGNGPIRLVRQWWRGTTRMGTIIHGSTGLETVVEEERLRPLHTFCIVEGPSENGYASSSKQSPTLVANGSA